MPRIKIPDMESSKTGLKPFKCAICGSYNSSFTLHQQHKSGHKKKYIARKNGWKLSEFRNKYKRIKRKISKTLVTEKTFSIGVAAYTPHTTNVIPIFVQKTPDAADLKPKGAQKTFVVANFAPPVVQKTLNLADFTSKSVQKTPNTAECKSKDKKKVKKRYKAADFTTNRNRIQSLHDAADLTPKGPQKSRIVGKYAPRGVPNFTPNGAPIVVQKTLDSADFTSKSVQKTPDTADCKSKDVQKSLKATDFTSNKIQNLHDAADLTPNLTPKGPQKSNIVANHAVKGVKTPSVDVTPKGNIVCDTCHQCFYTLNDLMWHLQLSHNIRSVKVRIEMKKTSLSEQKKSRTCDKIVDFTSNNVQETGKTFLSEQKKSRTHNQIVDFTSDNVQETGKTFFSEQKKLRTHDQIVDFTSDNLQETVHKCGKCNECFSNMNNLMLHFQVSHPIAVRRKTFLSKEKKLNTYDGVDTPKDVQKGLNPADDVQKTTHVTNFIPENVQKTSDAVDFAPKGPLKTLRCEKCPGRYIRYFNELNDLNTHMQKSHNSTKDIFHNPFSCAHCDGRFRTKQSLEYHEKMHKSKRYQCNICHERFTHVGVYKEHVKRHSQGCQNNLNARIKKSCDNTKDQSPFSCAHCNWCFRTKYSLECHEKTHESKNYECNICQEHFTHLGVYKEHVKSHNNNAKDQYPFSCAHCDRSFRTKYFLYFHEKIHSYKCNLCPERFTHLDVYKEHVKSHNNNTKDQNPFSCAHCDKRFRTKYSLGYHEKTHESKKYECNICHERFTYIGLYKEHVRGHNQGCDPRGITFQCQYCPSHFTTVREYAAHTKTHSQPPKEKPFECTHCDKSFFCTEDMERHVLTHTRVKVKKKFKCQFCAKVLRANNQAAHMRIHYKEKPFLCQWCGRLFIRHDTLQKHLLIHTDEKPYECDYCHAHFRQSGTMRQHMKEYCKQKPSDGKDSVSC